MQRPPHVTPPQQRDWGPPPSHQQIGALAAAPFTLNAVLRLQDVSCAHQDRVVLDRINLSVAAGQITLLRGRRGAGKSTLLAVAAATLRPGAGRVFVADRDIVDLQTASLPFLRRNIGYLPPDAPLIGDETALENVMLALAVRGHPVPEAEDESAACLQAVGLPLSLATALAADLSWTQRRLVALARALVGAPPLVVLDEPTAGLAAEDGDAIVKALQTAQSDGAAILCASRDEALCARLSLAGATCLELESGRLLGGPRMTVLRGKTSPLPQSDGGAPAVLALEDDVAEELGDDDIESLVDDSWRGRP